MPRYLTKSRFKLGLECPTKLFYTNKKSEYLDLKIDDSFLAALAEGGFQIGELAKLYYPGGINIDELDHHAAIEKTNELLALENVTIYEAAFLHNNLFIRADILIKKKNYVELIEVKAKSIDSDSETFLGAKGYISSKWQPYLYDIAFQKYVVQKCNPEFNVSAYLFLTDKSKIATVDGLNQKFLLVEEGGRTKVKVNNTLDINNLGQQLLSKVNVDSIINLIYNGLDRKEKSEFSFEETINQYSSNYENDIKIKATLSSKCSKCEFKLDKNITSQGIKSGFHECWKEAAGFKDSDFDIPNVLSIWDFRKKDEYINKGIYFQEQLERTDLEPKSTKVKEYKGMSRVDRQEYQVLKSKEQDNKHFIDIDGLRINMNAWKFPLHFIDFETTSVAIPFNKGRRPYEQTAFQFSHHVVQKDGTIEHKGQWINTTPGYFPNFDFVRELKKELEVDNGSIFKYAAHENTILNAIYIQLKESTEPDKDLLCNWIKTVTHSKTDSVEQWKGERDMIDLREIVLKFYYNPLTNGSNSIKHVLPAILNSSEYLKKKYSKSVYGKEIKSLNFFSMQWVYPDESGFIKNPYKLLPKVHEDFDNDTLDNLVLDEESGIYDGGAAMTAYARMQFSEMSNKERERIKDALLRYCELDTFAMVMLWEAWNDWCK